MKVRVPRLARLAPAAAGAVLAVLTVLLAQEAGRAAFTAGTGSTGNSVTAATSFCASAGQATVTAAADSYVDEGSPTNAAGGNDYYLVVTPQAGSVRRSYLRFSLPSIPAGCEVTSATLRIFAETQVAGRVLGVYRADPTAAAWTEAGLTWNNKPAAVGTPATVVMPATDQYVEWPVTALVQVMYASGNNGFVVRDQDETGPGAWQQFMSRAATSPPQLRVVWG